MKGDSFSTIAKKYGVTSRAIQEANPGVEPTRLKIGQKLVIPARSASATTATPPTNGASGAAKTYTVKSGDTLQAIARRNGVTVKELQAANNLTTTRITVGQKLRIPSKETAAPTP
jgi:membrane-bound lytic murein transglycosylase D